MLTDPARSARWSITVLLGALAAALLPAAHSSDRNALREIVQEQCVPDWRQRHKPAPCERVVLSTAAPNAAAYAPDGGYAVLHDRKGGAHFLLIPISTVTGIESPALLQGHIPNYFQAAWQARDLVSRAIGHAVTRDQLGLAINSHLTRGQDQLHIHIECLGVSLYQTLRAHGAELGPAWSSLQIGWWHYQARRVTGASLLDQDPFRLLAEGVPGARARMGAYTLVVAGMQFTDGPGFALIAARDVPGGETLLDGTCAIAQPKSSGERLGDR